MFSLAKALFYIVGILFGLHCAISLDFSLAANMRVSAVFVRQWSSFSVHYIFARNTRNAWVWRSMESVGKYSRVKKMFRSTRNMSKLQFFVCVRVLAFWCWFHSHLETHSLTYAHVALNKCFRWNVPTAYYCVFIRSSAAPRRYSWRTSRFLYLVALAVVQLSATFQNSIYMKMPATTIMEKVYTLCVCFYVYSG